MRLPALVNDEVFIEDVQRMGRAGQTTPATTAHIAAIAPSSGVGKKNEPLIRGMAEKLAVTIDANSFSRDPVPYTANTDDHRLNALVEALVDPDIEVIWTMRGGYGASRLLEGLSRVPSRLFHKKMLIGYSDITFLHLFFQKLGWQTVHGAMFAEMANPAKDEQNFRQLARLVSGQLPVLTYTGLKPRNRAAHALAEPIRGVITGGNLTCVAAAVGTPWGLDASGKILFLEDVEEPGYKVDRMLTQLTAAGQLEGVRAILFGAFSDGDALTAYALERFANESPVPVFSSEQFGHGPTNLPLLFNAPATLGEKVPDTDEVTLSIQVTP